MPKLNVLDLYSGCGGFSYGFQQEKYHIVAGIDFDEIALKTFEKNHSNAKALNVDFFEDNAEKSVINQIRGQSIDVLIAGPPCQGFSLTGTRRKEDKRNKLFYGVFNLAKKLKPKAIVIENVPGIVNLYNGEACKEIHSASKSLGYSCTHKELFAPDYGVPQIRKRVFFVCLQNYFKEFSFPTPTHRPEEYVSCSDAISDLPNLEYDIGGEISEYILPPITEYQKIMRQDAEILYNHLGTRHTAHVINVISQVPEGGNYKDLPPGVGDSRIFNEAWTRYHSQKPSKTIDTGHRNHFHYKYHRVPTIRENARLQSFPDKFVFIGTKTQQNKQVGNAVPPLLGRAIGFHLKQYISK